MGRVKWKLTSKTDKIPLNFSCKRQNVSLHNLFHTLTLLPLLYSTLFTEILRNTQWKSFYFGNDNKISSLNSVVDFFAIVFKSFLPSLSFFIYVFLFLCILSNLCRRNTLRSILKWTKSCSNMYRKWNEQRSVNMKRKTRRNDDDFTREISNISEGNKMRTMFFNFSKKGTELELTLLLVLVHVALALSS